MEYAQAFPRRATCRAPKGLPHELGMTLLDGVLSVAFLDAYIRRRGARDARGAFVSIIMMVVNQTEAGN